MTASPYASDAKIAEACAALGADLIGQTEQTLLQQLVVAAATNTGSTPGGAAWGGITGTLSAQTDLQTALDAKLNLTGGTLSGLLTVAAANGIAFPGTTSGTATVKAAAVAGTPTITLPDVSATLATLGANTFTGNQLLNVSLGLGCIQTAYTVANARLNGIMCDTVSGSATPSVAAATSGIYFAYSDRIGFINAGVFSAQFTASELLMMSTYNLQWTAATPTSTATTFLNQGQAAAATLQMGKDGDSAIAQTFKAHNAVAANTTAAKMRLAPGQSTGSATPAVLALQGTAAGGSGASVQTLVDVLSIIRAGVVRITGIPTSSAGLSSGDIYSNAGILTIVP